MPDVQEEKILVSMRRYFGSDTRRIQHAEKVLAYAHRILESEKGEADIVIPAAILHDIGIKECERKYSSTSGQLQEKEGPAIAKNILEELGITENKIEEICQIIASHHSPGEVNTNSFKVIWDADWLVNLKDEYNIEDIEKLKVVIEKIFITETGKNLAREIYLKR